MGDDKQLANIEKIRHGLKVFKSTFKPYLWNVAKAVNDFGRACAKMGFDGIEQNGRIHHGRR